MKLISTFTTVLLLLLALFTTTITAKSFDEINWVTTLAEAKAEAQKTGKNMAVLITKGYCGACRKLKSSFEKDKSNTFEEQGENFVLVHLADSNEPSSKDWSPDGGYIPRLIFADANGTPLPDIKQNNRDKYQYFYHDVFSMVTALKNAEEVLN